MKKHFYSHLIEIDAVIVALDSLSLSKAEKEELIALINNNIHTAIMEITMSQIPKEDRKHFISHLESGDHAQIWNFLNQRTLKIDSKIKKVVKELTRDFLHDITSLKSK